MLGVPGLVLVLKSGVPLGRSLAWPLFLLEQMPPWRQSSVCSPGF